MKGLLRLTGIVLSISFLGSLPLGTLNLSVANYAFRQDWRGAGGFSIAAIVVEMALVRGALVAIRRLERLTHFERVFHLLTGGILLFLAWGSLLAAWRMETFRVMVPFSSASPLLSGLLLSLANPLHLPFWMGWIAVLRARGILSDGPRHPGVFIAAIGLGSAAAFFVYALAGGYLIGLLGRRQVLLNWAVGVALLVGGVVQLYKTFIKNNYHGKDCTAGEA